MSDLDKDVEGRGVEEPFLDELPESSLLERDVGIGERLGSRFTVKELGRLVDKGSSAAIQHALKVDGGEEVVEVFLKEVLGRRDERGLLDGAYLVSAVPRVAEIFPGLARSVFEEVVRLNPEEAPSLGEKILAYKAEEKKEAMSFGEQVAEMRGHVVPKLRANWDKSGYYENFKYLFWGNDKKEWFGGRIDICDEYENLGEERIGEIFAESDSPRVYVAAWAVNSKVPRLLKAAKKKSNFGHLSSLWKDHFKQPMLLLTSPQFLERFPGLAGRLLGDLRNCKRKEINELQYPIEISRAVFDWLEGEIEG